MDITYLALSLLSVPASWLLHGWYERRSDNTRRSMPDGVFSVVLYLAIVGVLLYPFYIFTAVIYHGLADGTIVELSKHSIKTRYFQHSSEPVTYWFAVALAYFVATAVGFMIAGFIKDLIRQARR